MAGFFGESIHFILNARAIARRPTPLICPLKSGARAKFVRDKFVRFFVRISDIARILRGVKIACFVAKMRRIHIAIMLF